MDIALALILHPTEKKVLIAQRKAGTHLAGFWEFPGGKCLPDEAASVCAVREAREEVGLDVAMLEGWPPITHCYPERTVTLYPFLCRASQSNARPLGSRQVLWAAPNDLDRYRFPDANTPLVARLKALLLS